MVPLYHEIDDLVELLPISTSTEFGDHNISKWINNPNNITTTMTYMPKQANRLYYIPSTCPDVTKQSFFNLSSFMQI